MRTIAVTLSALILVVGAASRAQETMCSGVPIWGYDLRTNASASFYGQPVRITKMVREDFFPEPVCRFPASFFIDDQLAGTVPYEWYLDRYRIWCTAILDTPIGEPGLHRICTFGVRVVEHVVFAAPVAVSTRRDGNIVTVAVTPQFTVSTFPTAVTVSEEGRTLATLTLDHGIALFDLSSLEDGTHALLFTHPAEARFQEATVTETFVVDNAPRLAISSVAVDEGDTGEHLALIPVSLSKPASKPVSVSWATANGTAAEGSDYAGGCGTLTMEPGQSEARIAIAVNGDLLPEETESFHVTVRDVVNAVVERAEADVTIFSDDALFTLYPDVLYGSRSGRPLLLSLRVPTGEGPHPLVMAIDAPSWTFVTRHAPGAEWLAHHGFAVATVEFTPATIAAFPTQLEDVRAALRWLQQNADAYAIDPAKIAVFGIDAGGYLASLLGTRGDTQSATLGERPRAVVTWFAPADLTLRESCGTLAADVSVLLGCATDSCGQVAALASPVTYATPDDTPFLIVHGEQDCDVPIEHSLRMERALRAAHVDVTLVAVPAGHRDAAWDASDARNVVLRFLQARLAAR